MKIFTLRLNDDLNAWLKKYQHKNEIDSKQKAIVSILEKEKKRDEKVK